MVCAILSPADSEMFDIVYLDLKRLAFQPVSVTLKDEDEPRLPQVHALNCLKDIMTHSRFRTCTEQYVGEMLELAADRLSSPTWAIRNCGLMLFQACANRIETQGLQVNRAAVDVTLDSTSSPLAIAAKLLKPGAESVSELPLRPEIIFAALDLAKHINVKKFGFDVADLVYLQLRSTVWAIRDHAARVMADYYIATYSNRYNALNTMPKLSPDSPDNLLHGTLLLFRYILEGPHKDFERNTGLNLLQDEQPDIFQDEPWMVNLLIEIIERGCSPYTVAAWFDVANNLVLDTLKSGIKEDSGTEALRSLRARVRHNLPLDWSCHAKLLLNEVLCFLVDQRYHQTHEAVDDALLDRLGKDPDAARFFLECIQGRPTSQTPGLIDLFVRLVIAVQMPDVRALAMTSLIDYIKFCGIDLSDQHAASLVGLLERLGSDDRTLWNASMQLEACLIRTQLSAQDSSIARQIASRLTVWLNMMTMASKDQLEFPTRYSAAVALRQCARTIIDRLDRERNPGTDELTLRLLLLIYDQLNDDDEEIRQVAETTASNILQGTQQISILDIPACAIAARRSLLQLMVDRHGSGSELLSLALTRIVGKSYDEVLDFHSSLDLVFRESVEDRLARIRASMNDLFVEEKQNLYLDELNEVQEWSKLIRQCENPQLEPRWRKAAVRWCEDGLETLLSLLGSGPEKKELDSNLTERNSSYHPLGPTYSSEVLVLFLRLVALSNSLVAMAGQRSGSGVTGVEKASVLRQKTTKLREAALKVGAHRRVMEALGVTQSSERD